MDPNTANAQLRRPALGTPVGRPPAGNDGGDVWPSFRANWVRVVRRPPLVAQCREVRSVWFIEISEMQARTLRRRPPRPPICPVARGLLCPRGPPYHYQHALRFGGRAPRGLRLYVAIGG